jgi:hypothetical protein
LQGGTKPDGADSTETLLGVDRRAKLAKVIRHRPLRVTFTAGFLLTIIAASLVLTIETSTRIGIGSVRADYETTWCATFGKEDWDTSGFLSRTLREDPHFGGDVSFFEGTLRGEMDRWIDRSNHEYTKANRNAHVNLWFQELNTLLMADYFASGAEASFPNCS